MRDRIISSRERCALDARPEVDPQPDVQWLKEHGTTVYHLPAPRERGHPIDPPDGAPAGKGGEPPAAARGFSTAA
jgi:hypothetical protein